MQTYRSIADVPYVRASVVTVGTFDGVHRGHQVIIERLLRYASSTGTRSVVVTFEPHPRIVLQRSSQAPISLLTTFSEKHALLQRMGIDVLVVIPFTFEFANTTAEEFVRQVLVERIGLQHIVIGYDHSFGKDRGGDEQLLRRLGVELGFSVERVEPVLVDGETVSSTRIRHALLSGNIEKANSMLGYPFSIEGIVVEGDGRGRRLGYPTANIELLDQHKILPGNGVYCITSTVDGVPLQGMANIGIRPTFTDSANIRLEAHFFDFSGYLYGRKIVLSFHKYIRPERRFESVDMFWSQLQEDRECCERYFATMSSELLNNSEVSDAHKRTES
ncbi:MAG: bifunctional riboflavin kinase/FAD synthetase [Bacteroidota bacterium]|nr:bifunctional riboflavin kinase/FAD synthetase [Candidatus Kapabacteria bacterium]MCS7302993.1 bifunctional riboflavin kinase/FAD synthetase [Candidatus Kapabacteria bacterium]MCX7937380.1 bifunctional riboflavin kinase/FAD synthetase [Chlorobiota bacterium]MDW8074501.1 bifunctional riboflavin kinase/FAD synthetase [Bacteroidota bacterium]MDW8271023.1 bifunctional riboflavin kinase/FAD synthetase [Bacteroidota bacterium]